MSQKKTQFDIPEEDDDQDLMNLIENDPMSIAELFDEED